MENEIWNEPNEQQELFGTGSAAMAAGVLLVLAGFGVALLDLAGFAMLWLLWGFLPRDLIVLLVILCLGLICAGFGFRRLGALGRFHRYVQLLQGQEYASIQDLGRRTGWPKRKVVRDLHGMIRKGWFRQGYLDDAQSCLMVSDRSYQQYARLMDAQQQEAIEREQRAEAAKQQSADRSKLPEQARQTLADGDAYLQQIRGLHDSIRSAVLSVKLSQMEATLERIFNRVEQHPESAGVLKRLLEYYLPMTVKLLTSYREMEQPAEGVETEGGHVASSMQEIEQTFDTLNKAYEKLLDDLFQDTAWDLSSDISVLNTLLAQDGLTDDGMKTAMNDAEESIE